MNASKSPNVLPIASAIAPVGAPPPVGLMIRQNSVWFTCPPPLLRTAVRMSSGTRSMLRSSSSGLMSPRSGCFSIAAFRLFTYAAWCLSWCRRMVCSSIAFSSASYA